MTEPLRHARIPRATYRLQLHEEFNFDDAIAILPYLKRLGISDVYCSPILRARAGSRHGYDIVAHDEINPELGGREGFDRFTAALQSNGLRQIIDIVPNHMGVLGADNPWWIDVLESGQASPYAAHFDIDWNPVNPEMRGKVLLPVLGAHYGEVLGSGDLVLAFNAANGSFAVNYHEHSFPVDPRSMGDLLQRAAARSAGDAALAGAVQAAQALTKPDQFDVDNAASQSGAKAALKSALQALVSPDALAAIAAEIDAVNADASRDALHSVLDDQAYRLAFWRVAADEINYRRFFDINELAALRMENPAVFEATHALPLELAASGAVDGLRIDHPDGLHDPAGYFRDLQAGYAQRVGAALADDDGAGRPHRPIYVVAEKIAAGHEDVPLDWHIHGTTGYRFATVVNGVLVDTSARAKFTRIWEAFTGLPETFDELAYQGKRDIIRTALASELTVLTTALLRIARADRMTRDFTFNTLRDALAEVAACMPVYRTYNVESATAQDVRYIDWAIAHARKRSTAPDLSIYDFVRCAVLAEPAKGASEALRAPTLRFARRFQQFCAPVAAKGVEDTAFYQYSRLASLNEVGGDPEMFGMTPRAFHGANGDRATHWPHTLIATSTHDNKRSEDVRCRIDVLSEMPGTWRLALRRWRKFNRSHRTPIGNAFAGAAGSGHAQAEPDCAPSAADEYLLYQILLGTLPPEGLDDAGLPAYRERIEAYALKAARESKVHTSWTRPDADYEAALTRFIGALLGRRSPNPFLDDLHALARSVTWYGALNSLSMALIKFTAPGVPDLYQGNEVMDLSLVDPDNRRPVDYGARSSGLDALEPLRGAADSAAGARALAESPTDGRAKLWLTWSLLRWREQHEALFRDGAYAGLAARGAHANSVVAYARGSGTDRVLVIAGRLWTKLGAEVGSLPLGSVWGDTTVTVRGAAPGSRWRNVLTGEVLTASDASELRLADAFANFPAAALEPI